MFSTGSASLLGVMLVSAGVSDAARETVTTAESGVTFTGVRYDDGRDKPYRIKFRQDDTRSLYMFNSATQVTDIKVGTERYKVLYDTSDNLESVELASSTRRVLTEDENEASTITGRRLDFADCSVCGDAWDALCAGGRGVCDLVDYGSPFSAAAAASVEFTCEIFCRSITADRACRDQCTEELQNISSCLDPTSGDYKCAFSGDTTIVFTDCYLTAVDVAELPACFEEFGKSNIQKLYLDNGDIREYADGTFDGLFELTSLDLYSNKLETVSEGLFNGLTKLEFLDMAFNDLVSLPEGAFSDLASLKYLRLFSNELTPETLPLGLFAGVPLLQGLYLDSNSLADMTSLEGLFDGLTELTHLGLGDPELKIVPAGLFAGLTKLEYLSLWKSSLSSLPEGLLSDLKALRTLALSGEHLTELGASLKGLADLRILLLNYQPLKLTEDVFSDLVNLEELELRNCDLTTLPAGLFSPMVNLVKLELGENEDLQCLPSTAATDVDLESEDIRDGTCECTPAEAVFCDDGLTCQSGMAGYSSWRRLLLLPYLVAE